MPLKWESDPIPLGTPLVSRFSLTKDDEDATPYVAADLESWALYAYQGDSLIFSHTTLQDIADIIVDPPGEWDLGDDGYNFEYRLIYGGQFKPIGGLPVRLVFWMKRANSEGMEKVEHIVPLTNSDDVTRVASLFGL